MTDNPSDEEIERQLVAADLDFIGVTPIAPSIYKAESVLEPLPLPRGSSLTLGGSEVLECGNKSWWS